MVDAVEMLMKLASRHNPDQTEAYWSRNELITIRMAESEIVEAKSISVEGASLRLILNKSVGFASTTEISDRSLRKIVDNAYKISKSKSSDPDFRSLPEPEKAEELKEGYDEELAAVTLDDAVKYGAEMLKTGLGLDRKIDLSGSINFVKEECKVQNSLGVDVSDESTFVFASVTVEKGEEISSVGQTCSTMLKKFNPVQAVEEAVETVKKNLGGKGIGPGSYNIIFGPQACAELAEYILAYGVDLSSIDSDFSYFRGKLGTEVATEDFSLIDDGRYPEGIASKKVDDEGVPTRTTRLIKAGVLRNYLCDTYYSNKLRSSIREFNSTGNGFRFGTVPGRNHSSTPRIQPTNLVIEPGNLSLDELIENTKKGILLGRIWYTYPINPTVGEFSTTNRGNTFYIEDGEIKHPLLPNSFRINDSLPKLLKNIDGISNEQTQSVVWGGVSSCISPHVKFRDVNVTYSKEERFG
ncbi:MAG: TldD/PmbA family protein [Candidatus Bathyarchaeota archaeon]